MKGKVADDASKQQHVNSVVRPAFFMCVYESRPNAQFFIRDLLNRAAAAPAFQKHVFCDCYYVWHRFFAPLCPRIPDGGCLYSSSFLIPRVFDLFSRTLERGKKGGCLLAPRFLLGTERSIITCCWPCLPFLCSLETRGQNVEEGVNALENAKLLCY